MLNNFQLNEVRTPEITAQLNVSVLPIVISNTNNDIVFNSYGLQNSEIITSEVQPLTPGRIINTAGMPSNDGELFNSSYFKKGAVILRGRMFKNTAQELEDEIDTFKKAISQEKGNLDVSMVKGGTKRRYKATVMNFDSIFAGREKSDITTVPFSLKFLVHEGFAQDINFSSSGFTINDLEQTTALYNTGTRKCPLRLTFNFGSVNGITAILIENLTTNQSIKVTNPLVDTDILTVDGYEKTVELNGSSIDFDGYFPELNTGENLIKVTLTGTSVSSITATAKTKNYYL